MFEQSLYEQPQSPSQSPNDAPTNATSEEGGLFSTYEIQNWSLGPRIYKILGMAALANVIALVIFAQGSLLTTKGCDSPLVGSVCSVLDTVYVGTLLFGTDREMVDMDYEKTELANAEVIFTGMTPESEKVSYPEGYFQIANPIEYQAKLDAMNAMNMSVDPTQPGYVAPGIPIGIPTTPSRSGGSIFDTKPKTPKRNDNLVAGIPSSIDDVNDATPIKTPGKRPPFGKPTDGGIKPGKNPTTDGTIKPNPDPGTTAQTSEEPLKTDRFEIKRNPRPLGDFVKTNKDKIETMSPVASYKVAVTADIVPGKDKSGKENGTYVLKNVKTVEAVSADSKAEEMAKLTIEGILAVGDDGLMGYLRKFDVKKVLITVEQNPTDFKVSVRSDQPDENTARTIASGLGGWLTIGKATSKGDDLLFLQNANLKAEGKAFIFNFAMPTPALHDMIKRKITEPDKKDGRAGQNAKLTQNIG